MNICPSPDCQRTHTIVSSTNVTIEKIQAIASQGDLSHHWDQLNQLLECAVCCCRFNKAATTACGHTFCHSCLERSMDHLAACPVCRSPVDWIPPPTQLLCNLIVDLFDDVETSDQLDDIDDNHVPILIGALAFPQVRCFIHIFEPRYRLMLRRVMQSRRRRFAVCLAKRRHENSPGFHEYGTMLELTQVKTLSDGRSIVEAVGSHRFRVVQHSMLDGYHVGELECIDDVDGETEQAREREQILQASASRARGSQQQTLDRSSPTVTRTLASVHRQSWAAQAHPQTQMARSPWLHMHVQGLSAARPKPMQQRPSQTSIPPAATSQTPSPPLAINRQEQTTDDLLNVLASFVNNMRCITMTTTSGSSDRFAQWLQALGEPPSISGPQRNKISFIWWVANMMPLDDQEKVKLLAMRFLRDRVLTLVGYMDRLKDQWSYWLRSNAEGRASGNASTPPSCCIS